MRERKRKRDCVLCARLMRNGCAHIIYVIGHFSKTRPKRSHHPTAKIEEKRGRKKEKKTFSFLLSLFFRSFLFRLLFRSFSLSLFSSRSLFIFISLFFFFFLTSWLLQRELRERTREEEKKRQSRKIREERAERHDHFHSATTTLCWGRKIHQRDLIHFLITTSSSSSSSSPPLLTLHLLRSRYI